MGFELLVGPPGSGKTHLLIERAREVTDRGERVWWAGLPNQRAQVYRRATRRGAMLGLEFQTLQQVYYRLLAHARRLKPLVVGTGRLALVGEALTQQRDALPTPGEARLFAAAIAEAKRFGLTPADLPSGDSETERLRAVYEVYERLKGEAWDYDDFRQQATLLAESDGAVLEAQTLIVDGFRELSPLDLRLLKAVGRSRRVLLALPRAPAGLPPAQVLSPRQPAQVSVFQAPNPVSEARWVLGALKRDLACGIDPLDLAVVLPRGESVAFAALADEYGVPVMDERPTSLADSEPGRILLELLELPDYPTASRLLPIRELAPLAAAAIDAGVAGPAAIDRLAQRLGLGPVWREWLERLRVPRLGDRGDLGAWAAELVDLALSLTVEGSGATAEQFRDQALLRAKEAARVSSDEGFSAWWTALLNDANLSRRPLGGVALVDERQASGRRYRKAYLLQANEGSYGTFEREDYFLPEEERAPLARLLEGAHGILPKRFEGRDELLFDELLNLADEVTITFPAGDQGGPLLPETVLLGNTRPEPLPPQPAASRLVLEAGERFRAPLAQIDLRSDQPLSLEALRGYDECAMQHWLQRLTGAEGEQSVTGGRHGWRELRRELLAQPSMSEDRLNLLRERFQSFAPWLEEHEPLLLRLRFGVSLPLGEPEDDRSIAPVAALLDAAVTDDGEAFIYTFTSPTAITSEASAEQFIEERWTELWAAGHLLERYRGRVRVVRLFAWPLGGQPIEAYPGGIRKRWGRIAYRTERAQAALRRLADGSIEPSPGFRCKACGVRDICREGST